MSFLADENLRTIQARLRQENPRLFNNTHSATEREQRLKSRLFQREVAAAAAATGYQPQVQPSALRPHPQPSASNANAAHLVTMSNDMTLDSLMVKILGMVYPPLPMTQELRDLIIKLPVAINRERAAREAMVPQPVNQGTVGGAIASKDAEIKKLKATVKELENQTRNQSKSTKNAEISKLKSEKAKLATNVKRLEQEVKNAKAPHDTLSNPLKSASQAVSSTFAPTGFGFTAPPGGRRGDSHQKSSSNAFVTRPNAVKPECELQHITKTGSNLLPVTNLQPRFQNRAVSPAKDPRPQIYTTSALGFYYQSTQNTNVFQGNERQTIHPSRMGQMDESSVTKLHDPLSTSMGQPNTGVSNVGVGARQSQAAQQAFQKSVKKAVQKALYPDGIPATQAAQASENQAAEKPSSGAKSSTLGGVLQQPTSLSSQPISAPAARKALPNEMWKSKFGGLDSNPSSQSSQLASFNGTEKKDVQDSRLVDRTAAVAGMKRAASPSAERDAVKKSKGDDNSQPAASNGIVKTKASPLQDPRLLDRSNNASVKKRAVSPSGEQDVAKKAKTDAVEDDANPQKASNCVNKPQTHRFWDGNEAAKRLSQLNAEIERTQARYTEANHYRQPSRTSIDSGLDVSMANTTPRYKASQRINSDPVECSPKHVASTSAAKSSPAHKERRRSDAALLGASDVTTNVRNWIKSSSEQTSLISAPVEDFPSQNERNDSAVALPATLTETAEMDNPQQSAAKTTAIAPASVKASPTHEERRDSAVAIADAPLQIVKAGGRILTCMHCRFAKLPCNQQKPCQNCESHKCVYVTCPYGMDCISAGCWYSHDPAESVADKSTSVAGVDLGTHA